MFNSYSSSQGGHANASNNLKINAVSGNLIKNHPLSIFVTATTDSTLFDPTNPRYNFPKIEARKVTKYDKSDGYDYARQSWPTYETTELFDKEVPCTVLQAMIIGEGLFLCEIVKTEDFFSFFVDPDEDPHEQGADKNE